MDTNTTTTQSPEEQVNVSAPEVIEQSAPVTGLSDGHKQALLLIESGTPFPEICKQCGFTISELADLYTGNTQVIGRVAEEFAREIEKINKLQVSSLNTLIRDTQKLALTKLNEYIRSKISKKTDKYMMYDLVKILTAVSKAAPEHTVVKVGDVTVNKNSITNNFSDEELKYEFKRLSSEARELLDRGRVRLSKQGTPAAVPSSVGSRPKEEEIVPVAKVPASF